MDGATIVMTMINTGKLSDSVYDSTYDEYAVACGSDKVHGIACHLLFGNGMSAEVPSLPYSQPTEMVHPDLMECLIVKTEQVQNSDDDKFTDHSNGD